MHNIKIILEYDGSNYSGWQRLGTESKKDSIQSVLEKTISQYLMEEIKIIGSGRTDAGVHALGQTANFHCSNCPVPEILRTELNSRLPRDIIILHAEEMAPSFHSRYSAKSKTYEYRLDTGENQSVFTRSYTCHVKQSLNVSAMEQAAAYLTGTHDFKSFTSEKNEKKSTIRTIEAIKIYEYEPKSYVEPYSYTGKANSQLRIAITGDGFLYNMVRIIVGTLIEVGLDLKAPKDIPDILESKTRQNAGITVSSQGLFLREVNY